MRSTAHLLAQLFNIILILGGVFAVVWLTVAAFDHAFPGALR